MNFKILFLFVLIPLFISGCIGGSGGGGTTTAVVASTPSFLDSGTSLAYNSTNASTLADSREFQNFNYNASSAQNPLEVINAHKAYGYGLTGAGEVIAIMDTGLSTTHSEFDQKTITVFGTLDYADGSSASNDHGLFVSGIAAAENDDNAVGDGGTIQGVAPSANLHLSSYNKINGNSYYPTHWANATNDASNAVVQNNSWGINYQIDSLKSDISSNNWTNAYGIAQKFHSTGYTANEASANAYITALNNFQDHGVIVYALSNTSSYTDADFQAALPELFPELKEAWITAVNIEIIGSSGNETYSRKSAPCGATGSYCLGSDGYQVSGAGGAHGGASTYHETNNSGTSYVAPQISGAVALLAEAFPNHTPEQLTDRLLASADNSFFNHDAVVTFGNGVKHGYDDEFGHGILDIYAALQPITSSSDNRSMRLFTGTTLNDNSVHQHRNSKLITSSSFGDSIQRGLVGEVGFAYDDLDGGFQYDMNTHINLSNENAPFINVKEELTKLSDPIISLTTIESNISSRNEDVISDINDDLNASITLGVGSMPVQNFYDSNDNSVDLLKYQTPFLEANEGGFGINATFKRANSKILFGATVPIEQNNGQTLGLRKSLIGSVEIGKPESQSLTFMAGLTEDKDSLLGSQGTSAFSLDGSKSVTTFAALKAQKKLNNNFSITGLASLGNTDMSSPSNSFVDSATDVSSSSLALIANMKNITKDDNFSFSIHQPSRVENGSIAIKTASLADANRNILQTIKDIKLESSSRQVNYEMSYRKDLSENLNFSLKHLITNNLNHINTSSRLHSSYLGMDYKDLKLGFATNLNDSSLETQISYAISL